MGTQKVADRLRELAQPTGEEELLAVRYPRPRVTVPVWQAIVVACALLVTTAGWLVYQHNQSRSPVPLAAPNESMSTQGSEELVHTPELTGSQADVVVAVVGEVHNPGLFTLPTDARVADALEMAKPKKSADTLSLNLAQKLTDGQQLRVYAKGHAPKTDSASDSTPGDKPDPSTAHGAVNLNNATKEELKTLPGVGEVTAAAIVQHREDNGPFTSIDQLLDISGIGPAKFATLKPEVTV